MVETREKRDLIREIQTKQNTMLAFFEAAMPSIAPSWKAMCVHFDEYVRRTETDEPVAWLNFAIPPQLFFAMDIEPVYSDFLAFSAASAGLNIEYIDFGEQHVPDHVCADFKIHVSLFLTGDVPHPDVMVYSASPCDSMRTTYSAMAEYNKIPSFCLDAPYYRSERAIEYMADEFKRMAAFLEEQTGHKLEYEKLKKVMEYSNEAYYWYGKLNEFRPLIPNPFPSQELFMDGAPLTFLAGDPLIAEYYKNRYHEVKKRVETGVGYPNTEEKIRIVWPYGVYVEDLGVLSWLEQKYGAVSVNWMRLNCAVQPVEDLSSIDSIMRGLAETHVLMPMNREVHGPIDNFIDATLDLIRKGSADCVIVMGHVGCKANWASMKLYKDRVEQEAGIPLLVFEVDLFDPRIISTEQVKAKFADFMETRVIPSMEKRKKR